MRSVEIGHRSPGDHPSARGFASSTGWSSPTGVWTPFLRRALFGAVRDVDLDLVEEDLEAGGRELLLVLAVGVLQAAREVALDDFRRALGLLLRERHVLDLREACRELRRRRERRASTGCLRLLVELALFRLVVAAPAAARKHHHGRREHGKPRRLPHVDVLSGSPAREYRTNYPPETTASTPDSASTACAAARRASGTRYGEQLT